MSGQIPILDLSPEIEKLRSGFDAAYKKVLRHGRFIMGPEVQEFEQNVAEYLGVKHAIGVNSGTDALVIALRSAGIQKDDEVITTSFTFFATVESIEMIGAKPVYADIQEDSFNIDPSRFEELLTDRTKAILPVHLYGNPADMTTIMKFAQDHNLNVIEDCAQSFGAKTEINGSSDQITGSIGDVGAFSFFPSKNLGAFGDGGMLTTNDDDIAEAARKLRSHGSLKKYRNEMMGYNSRLDSLQAAFLNVKLKHIDTFNQNRREIAHRYISELEEIEDLRAPSKSDRGHVFHQFTIRVLNGKRDDLSKHLKENGIQTMIYYPVPCHKLPVYNGRYNHIDLPVTERLSEEVLSLPIGPFLKEEDQHKVIRSIKDFFNKC
ncbi:MAG: DegT/DnrJ/EryC1/StrS family aminotransferase [Balneolaceae bacterium]|nr:DegT/DnrJ/EryC1/StrS family aminotransferase [Balneolaceae bacterium]